MKASISFLSVSKSDGDGLATLRVAAMRESLERAGRFDPVRARERFLAGFEPQYTRAIQRAGHTVGFYVLKPTQEGLLLDHLYIHPSHQSQGIGATVLQHVFAQADSRQCEVRVGALRGSKSNAFYARHGFYLVEQAEYDNYYVRCPKPVP